MTQLNGRSRPRTDFAGRVLWGAALGFLCLVLAASLVPAAVEPPEPAMPDVQALGPQVGAPVPDFSLADQRGKSRTLASLMGSKGLMLVFIRSADW